VSSDTGPGIGPERERRYVPGVAATSPPAAAISSDRTRPAAPLLVRSADDAAGYLTAMRLPGVAPADRAFRVTTNWR